MAEIRSTGAPVSKKTIPVNDGKQMYSGKHNIADHFIGGNNLHTAPPSKVKDFVAEHDGHTVITNVRNSTIYLLFMFWRSD